MDSREKTPLKVTLKRSITIAATLMPLAIIAVVTSVVTSNAQPAKGANKFLGNITTRNQVRPDFVTYWNQITPENESKWGSVEGRRNSYNWGGVDAIRDYAEKNKFTWKFHTLIWGSQYPNWMKSLSQQDQIKEIEEWMDIAAKRYPNVRMIDVVNEAYPKHAPAPCAEALGGAGKSGFDWIIKSFELARKRWPNAILIYNDYNIIEWESEVAWMEKLIPAMLKANAPIDAIGCQAHDAYRLSTSKVKANIDRLAAFGLPLFISEYDIGEGDNNRQKEIMEEQFTMFWNHPKIVGITYWGYVSGSTWRSNTGLMSSSGAERPALTWLKEYVKKNPDPPNAFPEFLKNGSTGISPTTPYTIARPAPTPDTQNHTTVFDLQGRVSTSLRIDRNTIPTPSNGVSGGCYIIRQDGRSTRLITHEHLK